ncbi:GlxA family transcriptional regulator [Chelatococcus sambhunathii]|uniref:GlxA family transcriptional regulator n=1 Tax=Chelatococcus sambhunathii TaxID=363953 RepID=A0ABU1DEZ2_9HYPH|nr:GlxA family transcriptional regulator [Chelatococcus sambhunathii]MDR4306689.1 GlxA family transcriptional regulator [Chelatococcus sambhunathii]
MPQKLPAAEIGILIYPDAQLGAVHGLTDLFTIANRMARDRLGADAPWIRVTHWRDAGSAIERVFETEPGESEPDFVILPPAVTAPITQAEAKPFTDWLRERRERGSTLCSVCAGAFLLAETGAMAGRSVTTHWFFADDFARRFPDVRLETDKLVIDDGDLITAGGIMAWTDLGLKLVDRLLGSTVMLATAHFLLVDPPGREQRYYSAFSPRLAHGDEAILKVQHWLQATGAHGATLAAMAAQARLEERTFLRRFRAATGMKPTEYCQHLRIGRARELLETTHGTVERIAFEVGYEDASAFRKLFQRVVGLTPREFRQRFNAGAEAA